MAPPGALQPVYPLRGAGATATGTARQEGPAPVGAAAGDDPEDPSGDEEGTGSDVSGPPEVGEADPVGSGVGTLVVSVPVGPDVCVGPPGSGVPVGSVDGLEPLPVADGEVELGVGSVDLLGVGVVCVRDGSGCTCCCWPAGVVATVGGRTKP